jgi:hypothetical protein
MALPIVQNGKISLEPILSLTTHNNFVWQMPLAQRTLKHDVTDRRTDLSGLADLAGLRSFGRAAGGGASPHQIRDPKGFALSLPKGVAFGSCYAHLPVTGLCLLTRLVLECKTDIVP